MLSALRCIARRGINGALKRTACTSALQTKKIQTQSREYAQHKYATHSSRTSITTQLWEKRLRSEEEQLRKLQEQGLDAAKIDSELPSFLLDKKPSDSHVEVILPLGTDLALREQYINFYGNVRFERLLEDLDACAGNIAYLHAEDNNPLTRPLTIVTASVDRIDLLNKLHADRDVKMQGCVSYVGRSSMEVRIDVQAKDPLGVNKWDPLILATFTMVATCNGKAAAVNKLLPSTEHEKRLHAIGELNKQRRAEQAKKSLAVQPPTENERLIIHEMFVNMQKNQPKKMNAEELRLFRTKQQEFLQKFKHNNFRALAPEETPAERLLLMSETKLQSVVVCQPQERNMKNMIFGGYLMRKAAELAWTSAHIHCGVRPWFLALDSVSFHKGVEIGSMLIFNSEVIFTTRHALGIKVVAEVLNPRENTRDVTTSFHFTFTCPDGIVDKVVPNTYEEAMKFLEGKRRYEFGQQVTKEIGSKLAKFYL